MKVIHVPFCFYPDPVGGTEVYVEALAREQQARGMDVLVAAPAASAARYTTHGIHVRRFATAPRFTDLDSLYGAGDQTARHSFKTILAEERPDLVHLHAFTPAISAPLARDVRSFGATLVYTFHTPTASCQRGTLLRWGQTICDGVLDVHRCAACALHGLGIRRPVATLLGDLPPSVGQAVGRVGLAGGPWTALRMTDLLGQQQAAFHAFVAEAQRIVVLCQWTGDLLVRNGVDPAKLVLSRHGLTSMPKTAQAPARASRRALRVVFLGRLHPTKGADVLVRAIRSRPDADLELDVFGISQDAAGLAYARMLRTLAEGDARIRFHDPVPAQAVPTVLSEYDILAVPSQWLETGPLVVLEAFAAGLPVIGSRLGGIAELVTPGVDGVLVDPASVSAWADALGDVAANPELLESLKSAVRPPRRMAAVVDDMQTLYEQHTPCLPQRN